MAKFSLLRLAGINTAALAAYAIIGILITVLLMAALIFGAYGIYLCLLPLLGPGQAAFATAGAAILISALLLGIAYIIHHGNEKKSAEKICVPPLSNNLEIGIAATSALREQIKQNPKEAALIALIGGIVLGVSPGLAKNVVDAVKKMDL